MAPRTGTAITVGATTSTDARASYSNYGSCLDIFAPGSSITSSWIGSHTVTNTISGTSMATPHVAGVAALYFQSNPSASAATVCNALVANATANVVTSAGRNSPNVLLFSNYQSNVLRSEESDLLVACETATSRSFASLGTTLLHHRLHARQQKRV